jgi:hypothetical protein
MSKMLRAIAIVCVQAVLAFPFAIGADRVMMRILWEPDWEKRNLNSWAFSPEGIPTLSFDAVVIAFGLLGALVGLMIMNRLWPDSSPNNPK